MKKRILILLCIAMAGLAMSGCAANTGRTNATAAPVITNSPAPAATTRPLTFTAQPDTSPASEDTGMNSGVSAAGMASDAASGTTSKETAPDKMTPAQADRLAEQIEEAVERLSEVDDAEAVLSDGRVLIAVEFDDQYGAGLDERMKKMIVEAVQKIDSGLTEIEITDDGSLYGQVKSLGERLAKATGIDELADDFGDLWDRITGKM